MHKNKIELLKMQIDELKDKIIKIYSSNTAPDENVIRLTGELHTLLMKYRSLKNVSRRTSLGP